MTEPDDIGASLPEIPVIDAPSGPLELATIALSRMQAVLTRATALIPRPLLRWGDAFAAGSLRRAENPYLAEIDAIAELLGRPGAHALNFSFEMACTTACASPDPTVPHTLYRSLDWPFRLGADVVAARHAPAAGPYWNLTWPGFVGVLTGLAPSRFAAAINQPPMAFTFSRFGLGLPGDWLVNRVRVGRSRSLPPAHLLRRAFEICASYADAKAMLTDTPVCIPVIYALTGPQPGQGCVIERGARETAVHEAPVCVANHWLAPHFVGRGPRGRNSYVRHRAMQAALPTLGHGPLRWVRPPVLNRLTRMTAELDARSGGFQVRGWHGLSPRTRVLTQGCYIDASDDRANDGDTARSHGHIEAE